MLSQEQRIDRLEKKVMDLEEMNDFRAFTLLVSGLPKAKLPSFYACVEQGVADYFNIDRASFFHRLVVGNSYGRKGRVLPINPADFEDEEDKISVARFCLYAILHIDFCISIVDISDWYNVNAKNYIREWKKRYIRIFHEEEPSEAKWDSAYRRYYTGCHEAIVVRCQEEGLFDLLIENLQRIGLDGEIDYIYLKKWRLV